MQLQLFFDVAVSADVAFVVLFSNGMAVVVVVQSGFPVAGVSVFYFSLATTMSGCYMHLPC